MLALLQISKSCSLQNQVIRRLSVVPKEMEHKFNLCFDRSLLFNYFSRNLEWFLCQLQVVFAQVVNYLYLPDERVSHPGLVLVRTVNLEQSVALPRDVNTPPDLELRDANLHLIA